MLTLHDEQLVRQLQAIAEREKRPIEDVLKSLLAQYSTPSIESDDTIASEAVRHVRRKAYAEARRYWEKVGDTQRLQLTDEELDAQFWLFDGDGIPRLKSDQGKVQLPENSLHTLAEEAARASIQFKKVDYTADYDEILNAEFADYLQRRMQGKHDRTDPDR